MSCELLVANLGAVVANYRAAGVRRFVIAYSLPDCVTLEAIQNVMEMPVRVVLLTAPESVIVERLSGSPTSGRADDLARARERIAEGIGVGLEDVAVENLGHLGDTADLILTAIGWA